MKHRIALIALCAAFITSSILAPHIYANGTCQGMNAVINARGWEDKGSIEDGGKKVNLPTDSSLPIGFEAISEDAHIVIQDPDRFMHSGEWSIYRVCNGEVEPPDQTCPDVNDLISRNGWNGIAQVDDNGVQVQTFLDDSLPFGYEAIGEFYTITLDNPNRFMDTGVWSIYRLCGN